MKKKILFALITLALVSSIVLTGCAGGAGGVPQSDYDNLAAQLSNAQSQLTKAQTDLAALQDEKDQLDFIYRDTVSQLSGVTQQLYDLQEQYEYQGLSTPDMLAVLVYNYKLSHLYEKDIYDCNNMASDVWNMLKAQGISAVIVVGSIEYQITNILQSDHAWVLAEVAPGEYLALDPTVGMAFTETQNSRYYRGWSFTNPATLKSNDDLRTEYNVRVTFINLLVTEKNAAMTLYNNSSTQAEADKWFALYSKLGELKDAQEALLNVVLNQINQLATSL